MEETIEKYIQGIEEKLEELGVKVVIKDGWRTEASGKNALRSDKVDEATILTAKLEGFKDAVKLLEKK